MKSIKPGRGPSKLGMVGAIGAVLFGIFWCIMAGSMGAWFMIPFGLIFIGMAAYNALYHRHNAKEENRYSIVDIVDEAEEPDPLNKIYAQKAQGKTGAKANGTSVAYCSYCGSAVNPDFDFCPKCGKQLPD